MGKFVDLTGQVFGRLRVIERVGSVIRPDGTAGHARWRCVCTCARASEVIAQSNNLRSGQQRSCGCVRKEAVRKDPRTRMYSTIRSGYARNAAVRGLRFDLTLEQLTALMSQECLYCGAPPSNNFHISAKNYSAEWIAQTAAKYSGIDRLHNHEGYSVANCVPACATCNTRLRKDLPLDVWLFWLQRRQPDRYQLILDVVKDRLGPNWRDDVRDLRLTNTSEKDAC